MSALAWVLLALAWLAILVMATALALQAVAGELAKLGRRPLDDRVRPPALARLLDPALPLAPALHLIAVVAAVVATGMLAAVLAREGWSWWAAVTAALGLLVLVVALVVPAAVAHTRPALVERRLRQSANPAVVVAEPVAAIMTALAGQVGRRFLGATIDPQSSPTDEPRPTEQADGEADAPTEREMVANVLRLESTTVREVMVPRIDVVAVEEGAALPQLLAAITGGGHSRVPVYRETIDQIVGVLYAKDLLPFVGGAPAAVPLDQLLRPPVVVPESMRLDELLTELRQRRVHLAVVADEYGGTAGIVTIEDVLEEIVGEIQDEYDAEAPLIERLGVGELVADGRLSITDLAETLGLTLGETEYETVAGLVQHHLGRMPRPGDRLEIAGLRIEVLAVERHRLRRLRLQTGSPDAAEMGDTPEEDRSDRASTEEPR